MEYFAYWASIGLVLVTVFIFYAMHKIKKEKEGQELELWNKYWEKYIKEACEEIDERHKREEDFKEKIKCAHKHLQEMDEKKKACNLYCKPWPPKTEMAYSRPEFISELGNAVINSAYPQGLYAHNSFLGTWH